MATIQETFGALATLDTSTPSDPVLQIHLADMDGWDDPATATDPDKWLTAIMSSASELTEASPSEIRGVVVQPWQPGFVQSVVIDGSQVTAQSYTSTVTAYVPSDLATKPDIDDVV